MSLVILFFLLCGVASGLYQHQTSRTRIQNSNILKMQTVESVFSVSSENDISSLKMQVLHMGAVLDRGQVYNPTSGEQYSSSMKIAKSKIEKLVQTQEAVSSYTLESMNGEWELILSTVPHGIFRSSPFFLAIQEAFRLGGELEKANLFFKLHELQTFNFGASKIGRVAQVIDAEKGEIISEFDTSIFSLTALPIIGFWKLLPTFGGCVVTVSKCKMNENGKDLDIEVDYTTAKKVDGLSGLFDNSFDIKVPVGSVWKLLPWNNNRAATCSVKTVFLDKDFRIIQDIDGEYFVYTRPVVSRM